MSKSFETKECLSYPEGAPYPPSGQSVSFGEKFVVFEVDGRLICVVEMILIWNFCTKSLDMHVVYPE